MSATQKSNAQFYTMSIISSTQAAGTTFNIAPLDETQAALNTAGATITVALKSATQVERMKITAAAGVATIVSRGLDNSDTETADVGLQKTWGDGSKIYTAPFAFNYIDKQDAKPLRLTIPTVADNTARTALYPSPTGGEKVMNTANGGKEEVYNATTAQWEAAGTSTAIGNATTSAAGIGELSTGAEITSGAATGGTGAPLIVTPDVLIQEINGSTAKTSAVDADKLSLADSAASGVRKSITWAQVKTQLKADLPASNAALGFAQAATDSVAAAGTDNSTYTTPAQLAANSAAFIRSAWSTDFSTAARYTASVNGAATNTFDASGLTMNGGGTNGSWAKATYNPGKPFAVGDRVSFTVSNSSSGSNYECYFGVGTVAISGSNHTFTNSHVGFKLLKPAGSFSFSVTVANGSAETATVLTTTDFTSAILEASIFYRSASAVEFTYRTSGGSWSSPVTITTNIPSSQTTVQLDALTGTGGGGALVAYGMGGRS